jgi:hypothetical protein
MSQPTPFDAVPPRQGMSGTAKLLIGLGIGCAVLAVVCCGGGLVMVFMLGKSISEAASESPEKIREITASIVEIEIPDSFQPEVGLDAKIPVVGAEQKAVYRNAAAEGWLTLTQFTNPAIATDANLRQQLETSLHREYNAKLIDAKSSETFETTIHGQPATFIITEGTPAGGGDELVQVNGEFHGKQGSAELELQAKAAAFGKDQVMTLLKSMK